VTGIAQIAMPYQANASLIEKDGVIIGSTLIGQWFKSDRYFHPRPSATTDTDPNDSSRTIDAPYNAANSSGSNLGPTSQKLVDRVKNGVEAWRAVAGPGPVPADAVTTSASGLDPNISPENALAQAASVAKARGLPADRVRALVAGAVARPLFRLIGGTDGQCFAAEFGAGSAKIVVTTEERRWPNRADQTTDAPTQTRCWPHYAGKPRAG
jgi:K+-transporting ATPase ATPase C chain